MWGWPGKKLLFMGQEFAQREEWNEAKGLDWWLLDAGMHEGVRRLIGDLNAAYRELPALHARDNEPEGFEWLIGNDHANSVFAWTRKAPGQPPVVVIANMTPVPRDSYRVPMPIAGQVERAGQYRRRLVRRIEYGQPGQGGRAQPSDGATGCRPMPSSTCRRWRR